MQKSTRNPFYNMLVEDGKRTVAYLIDLTVPLGVALLIWLPFSESMNFSPIFFISDISVGLLYRVMMESSTKQATYGKQAIGMIVVDIHGERISLEKAFIRHLAKTISDMIPFIYLIVYVNKKKRGVHDFVANTVVVPKHPSRISEQTFVIEDEAIPWSNIHHIAVRRSELGNRYIAVYFRDDTAPKSFDIEHFPKKEELFNDLKNKATDKGFTFVVE